MTFIGKLMDKLLNRTGYLARDSTGKIVTGCFECNYNITVKNPLCDAHQCQVSVDNYGKPLVILDPYNVPELCSMRIEETKKD